MAYKVTVEYDDDYWLATVVGMEGAHTFATSLPALNANVREVIALADNLPSGAEDSLAIDWEIPSSPKVFPIPNGLKEK